jgi:hypothetical protein
VIVAGNVTAIRKHLEQYHISGVVMPRTEEDDPTVIETWL